MGAKGKSLSRREERTDFCRILQFLSYFYNPLCPDGGTGRRARLKLVFLTECGVDSHSGYRLKERLPCGGVFGLVLNHQTPYNFHSMKRAIILFALFVPFFASAQLQSPNPEAGETFVQKIVGPFTDITNDTGGPGQSYDLTYLDNPDWGAESFLSLIHI